MTGFGESHLGRLRALVGSRLLLYPGVRVVIEREDGKVLLQERSDFRLWGLPGGSPEEDESIDQALIREVREETGLDIEDPQAFGYASDPEFETIKFPNGDVTQYFVLLFHTSRFAGDLNGSDEETLALDWFHPDRLPNMLPNMARTIEAYGRFKAGDGFQLI